MASSISDAGKVFDMTRLTMAPIPIGLIPSFVKVFEPRRSKGEVAPARNNSPLSNVKTCSKIELSEFSPLHRLNLSDSSLQQMRFDMHHFFNYDKVRSLILISLLVIACVHSDKFFYYRNIHQEPAIKLVVSVHVRELLDMNKGLGQIMDTSLL